MEVLYTKSVRGTVEEVGLQLEKAVVAHQFGILGVLDFKQKMAEKGIPFERECKLYEICHPRKAKEVLEKNMEISTVLPCRIAIYEEEGEVKVSTMLPSLMIQMFETPELAGVAQEVEEKIKEMIDEVAEK